MGKSLEKDLSDKVPEVLPYNRLCHMVALTKSGKVDAVVDNLVPTVFVLSKDQEPANLAEVLESIEEKFGLKMDERIIRSSIDRLLSRGLLIRDKTTRGLRLSSHAREQIELRIEEANNLENSVRSEWLLSIDQFTQDLQGNWQDQLWTCLRQYMAHAFQTHGVQTIQILAPSSSVSAENQRALSAYFAETKSVVGLHIPQDIVLSAIKSFFGTLTPHRTRYLTQLLDGTFSFFSLTIDASISNYLKSTISHMILFLDTNFIFGILGLHANPLNDVSAELIDLINVHKLPFALYYHEATLEELDNTITNIGQRLTAKRWTQATSRAVVSNGGFSGLELKYHSLNAETPLDPEVFLSRYRHLKELLAAKGFQLYPSKSMSDAQTKERHECVARYLEYTRQKNREKPYPVLNHDIMVWQAAKSLRKAGASALDAGAFFLTADYLLYTFDWNVLRDKRALGTTILPNQFLQILRPFVPATDDFNRRFVETFAVPEFRTIGPDYSSARSLVIDYLNTYSDIPETVAVRILADELLLKQIESEESKTQELVHSAINLHFSDLLEERDALGEMVKKNALLEKENREQLALYEAQIETLLEENSRLARPKNVVIEPVVTVSDNRVHISNMDKNTKPQSPWAAGSFYLAALLSIASLFLVIARTVNVFVFPIVLIGSMLGVSIIGAFQLKNDSHLNDKGFLELMGLAIRSLPFLKRSNNKDKTPGEIEP